MKNYYDIPGSFGNSLIGETLQLVEERELFYLKRFCKYGSIFKTRVFGKNTVVFAEPDAAQFILKDFQHFFSSRIGWSFLEPIIGNGLVLLDGTQHKYIRTLMSPAFHNQAISYYFEVILNIVENYYNNIKLNSFISLSDHFRQLTLKIAFRLFLGVQAEHEIQEINRLFHDFVAGGLTILRLDTPLTKFGRALSARRKLEAYLRSVIAYRREDSQLAESHNALDILLRSVDEEGNHLSDSDIITQTLQLLVAAHDTTSLLLCWTLFELSAQPLWIQCLKDELIKIKGEQVLHFSHLMSLTQMSYVLNETLRLYPPIYSIPRGVVHGFTFANYSIPANWYVNISPLLIHRNESFYSHPDKFDPERFSPPREEHKKHPFAFIGFGGGSHRCLGSELAQFEMKIILATLIESFDWEVIPDYSSISPVIQLRKTVPRLQVKFTRRSP
jgi:cytochrome P450